MKPFGANAFYDTMKGLLVNLFYSDSRRKHFIIARLIKKGLVTPEEGTLLMTSKTEININTGEMSSGAAIFSGDSVVHPDIRQKQRVTVPDRTTYYMECNPEEANGRIYSIVDVDQGHIGYVIEVVKSDIK